MKNKSRKFWDYIEILLTKTNSKNFKAIPNISNGNFIFHRSPLPSHNTKVIKLLVENAEPTSLSESEQANLNIEAFSELRAILHNSAETENANAKLRASCHDYNATNEKNAEKALEVIRLISLSKLQSRAERNKFKSTWINAQLEISLEELNEFSELPEQAMVDIFVNFKNVATLKLEKPGSFSELKTFLLSPLIPPFFEKVLSHCQRLSILDVSKTKLHTLASPQWQCFWQAVANMKQLKTINLTEIEFDGITDDMWKIFIDSLQQLENLRELNMSDGKIGWLSLERLTTLAKESSPFRKLTKLQLRFTKLPYRDINNRITPYLLMLKNLHVIESLDLSDSSLEALQPYWTDFNHVFSQLQNLIELNFSMNHLGIISPQNLRILGDAINQLRHLRRLNLRANIPAERPQIISLKERWPAICNLINKNLTHLDFSCNSLAELTGEELQTFGNILADCPNLTTLDLTGNNLIKVTEEKWQYFIQVLKNSHITCLYIDYDKGELSEQRKSNIADIIENNIQKAFLFKQNGLCYTIARSIWKKPDLYKMYKTKKPDLPLELHTFVSSQKNFGLKKA